MARAKEAYERAIRVGARAVHLTLDGPVVTESPEGALINEELDRAHDVLIYAADEVVKPARSGGLPDLRELAEAAATIADALQSLATTRVDLAAGDRR